MSYFQNRGTVFTFGPDGGQNRSDQLYNDWEDMFADIQGVAGEKTIVLDNGALIEEGDIPVGTYDMDKITLAGPSGGARQSWSIGDGRSFPHMFRIARNLIIDYGSSSAPLCTIDDAVTTTFISVEDNVIINATSSRPCWQMDSNVIYNFAVNGGCRIGSPATFNDTIKTNGSGGGVTLNLSFDGASFIIPPQVLEGNATDTLNVSLRDSLSSVPDFSAEGFGTVTLTTGRTSDATFGPDGDASLSLSIDSGDSTAQESKLVFQDRGANKWELRKDASNDMALYDVAEAHTTVTIKTHADNLNALVIDDGNVGIRTPPDPSYDFHVLGTNMLLESETNLGLTLEGATGDASSLNFTQNGTNHWVLRSDGATNFVLKNGANDNIIGIINGVTTEAIRIDAAGEVGINNITPQRQLDVTGTGRFSDLLEGDGGIDINGNRVNSLGVASTGTNLTITTQDTVACTAGSITITLPAVASAGVGRRIIVKDRNGNANGANITIDGNASETIDGATTFVMNVDYQSVTLVNDGSTWMVV